MLNQSVNDLCTFAFPPTLIRTSYNDQASFLLPHASDSFSFIHSHILKSVSARQHRTCPAVNIDAASSTTSTVNPVTALR